MILGDDCLNVSKHRPIVCCFYISIINMQAAEPSNQPINWSKISNTEIKCFRHSLEQSGDLSSAIYQPLQNGDIEFCMTD